MRRVDTFRGRVCGRCLTVTWHPDSVRARWCPTCGAVTPAGRWPVNELAPVCVRCDHRHRPDLWCFSRHPTRVRRLLLAVLARDGDRCWLCGKPGANSVDHLVPQTLGGGHDPGNLRVAHRWCNAARKATPLGAGQPEHSRQW